MYGNNPSSLKIENFLLDKRFKIFTTLVIHITAYWVMILCSLVDVCQHFGGTYWHLLQFKNDNIWCSCRTPSSRTLGVYRAGSDSRLEAGCIIYMAIRINTWAINLSQQYLCSKQASNTSSYTKSGLSTESFPREIYFKSFCLRFSICKQNIYFECDDSHFFLNGLVPQATPALESVSVIAL